MAYVYVIESICSCKESDNQRFQISSISLVGAFSSLFKAKKWFRDRDINKRGKWTAEGKGGVHYFREFDYGNAGLLRQGYIIHKFELK